MSTVISYSQGTCRSIPVGHGHLIGYPDGGEEIFRHDNRKDLVEYHDQRQYVTVFAYDAINRLEVLSDPTGAQERYDYDQLGNLTGLVDMEENAPIVLH